MSTLDLSVILVFAVSGLGWLLAPGRNIVRLGALAAAALACVQFFAETFTWQFAPLYVGVTVLALFAIRRQRRGWISGAAMATLVLASGLAWMLLAVPRLPEPRGGYAVGSVTWRWIDRQRAEDVTDAPDDRRNVVAQAWYPAQRRIGPGSVYMDGLGRLPSRVSVLPGFLLRRFGEVDTHATVGAPVSNARSQWPVIIFSPGYGAPRAFYTTLVTDLASRGFVVILLDHPYEGPATELADGRLATTIEHFPPGAPNRIGYMETRLKTRVGDVRFVQDQLAKPETIGVLGRRLDLSRLAVIGHSFGGATAAAVMAEDKRPMAGADLDGMLYGGAERFSLGRPFLFIESDHAVTHHPPIYFAKRDAVLSKLGAMGGQMEIQGTNHFSFTDAEFFFAPVARPLARRLLGGSRSTADTERRVADKLKAWLRKQ